MKKVILSLAFMFLSVGVMAQTWRVVKKDGSVVRFPAAAVEYVTIAMSDDQSGSIDGHEYVDLGLPSGTLWATCNVGASKPEEFGDYFAWGETKPKNEYSWDTYKWCSNTFYGDSLFTKYCYNSKLGYNGLTDNLTELLHEDDAAYVNWGSNWCMPDSIQMAELRDSVYTTAEWTAVNNVYGCKITSNTNGNSIFLPAAGAYYGEYDSGVGRNFLYWSRTLSENWSRIAIGLRYEHYWGGTYVSGDVRCYGQSIRPVRAFAENGQIASITLNHSLLTLYPDSTAQLTATVMPSTAYGNLVAWTSSNDNVATVDQTGKVTAVWAGSCFIICVATDGSGVTATCEVRVLGNTDEHEYVDLGLPSGTLWATCNVGASKPEEFGDYFAWGETKPKDEYSWDTYKWCNMVDTLMTKYCNNSSYGYNGFTDNLMELLPEDDAAFVNWGSEWRMPTIRQFDELINSSFTTTEWVNSNGVYGRKITSKSNGNFIFLPAAGDSYSTSDPEWGPGGYYWSSSLRERFPIIAYELFVGPLNIDWYDHYPSRCIGQSVRPVRNVKDNK